ncbi:MAG: hypothetical protein M1426_04135 [Patescibacteria group bacterium]|nr:hypothetical protein [Patescibacteria group bacterium]
MYKYTLPHPIVIDLGYNSITKDLGYRFRNDALEFVTNNKSKGAQAANDDRQGYGILAEIVIRARLNLPTINDDPHPVSYDILSKKGVKIDIKCRGGEKDFEEGYLGEDGFLREAKHNLFARQLFDKNLDSDVFLLTHLKHPYKKSSLPGGLKDRSWKLYVCGWISKKRVLREAVYVPPGGISEQGNRWFPYQYQNIEVFNKCLNGFSRLEEILELESKDVQEDGDKSLGLHMTSVDSYRIIADLVGRSILDKKVLEFVENLNTLTDSVKPFLHPNQYFHLMRWLQMKGQVSPSQVKKLRKIITEKKFEGL